VKQIVDGAINAEVVLGLAEGKQAYAVVKSTDVMVAVD